MSDQNYRQYPPGYPPGSPPGQPPGYPPGQPPGYPPGQPPGYPPGQPPGYPPGQPPAPPPPSQPMQPPGGGYPYVPPPAGMTPVAGEQKPKMETMALISLIAGIVSLLFIFPGCCCWLSWVAWAPGAAAIVLGIMARNKINQDPVNLTGGNLALIGIISGAAGVVLFLLFVVLYILGIAGGVMQDMYQKMGR